MTWPKYTTYINVTDGLFVGNNHPVDARMTVERYEDLADLVAYNKAYDGLQTYVEDEGIYYSYINSEWVSEFPTVDTVPDSSLDFATGKTVIYIADEFPTNNVAYICVGGASGAKVWKAITA